jgi:hypothetical protein
VPASERRAAPTTARRHRRRGRFAAAVALRGGPGPVRGYANPAVDIRRTDGTYRVHIKNVYADQRQFHAAFATLDLDVSLSIVPVAPAANVRSSVEGETRPARSPPC